MYQIWRIYLDLWGHDCKKLVWPTFGCKLGQSDPIVMQLNLDMSCHLLNVYTKFQIDISKHVEEKSGKRGRTDGRTDGRTLPRHNTSRFSNGRIKTHSPVDTSWPGVGVTKAPFVNFSVSKIFDLAKVAYLLDSMNHIHIWQVSPQLSYGDTCQIYKRDIQQLTFVLTITENVENNGTENWLSNPNPSSW